MDAKDARGWPVRRNENGSRVCARRMCRETEYRINGYCSGYCEDVDALEQSAEEEIATLRAEVERLTKERDEIHDAIGIVGVDEPMTTLDAAQRLKAERDTLRADLSAAAGDLPVPVPAPGTDMARLLSANVLLRKERDEACEGESARAVERDEARKERDSLRALLSMARDCLMRGFVPMSTDNELLREIASALGAAR